ncbi:hypothetical protein [Sphingomonas sp. SAFR-052]
MNPMPSSDPETNDDATEVENEPSSNDKSTPDLPDDVAENLGDFA